MQLVEREAMANLWLANAFACSVVLHLQIGHFNFSYLKQRCLVLGSSSDTLTSRRSAGLPAWLPAWPHNTAEFWLRASSLQMQTLTPVPSGLQVAFLRS